MPLSRAAAVPSFAKSPNPKSNRTQVAVFGVWISNEWTNFGEEEAAPAEVTSKKEKKLGKGSARQGKE
jgi:hypothetical protein